MNAFTYRILLADNTKRKIRGQQITEHFAADLCGEGWWITHIPSGRALVLSLFKTVEDAKEFAKGYETVFGDLLDGKDDINIREKENAKAALCQLTKSLNKNPKVYTIQEIKRLMRVVYAYA